MQLNVTKTLTMRGQSEGLDRVESDLNRVSAAQEKVGQAGEATARVTETSTRRQISAAGAYQKVMERNDRLIALQARLARDTRDVSRAFEQGAIDAQEKARALDVLTTRYQRLVAAEERARASANGLASANDNHAASMMRMAAANDNAAGSTANIAAQFQDIGVTAAMGMNPIMIALQQGTQLSAVLNTMQNPLRGLGAAFISIINPVSLLTIGFVALTAAAIQFFTASNDNAVEAEDALKRHSEWLDKILLGYEHVRDAANAAGKEAQTLPREIVQLDLAQKMRELGNELGEVDQRIASVRRGFAETADFLAEIQRNAQFAGSDVSGMDAGMRQIEFLRDLELSAKSTAQEFNAAQVAAMELFAATEDEAIKDFALSVVSLVEDLRSLKKRMEETEAAKLAMVMSLNDMPDEYGFHLEAWGDITRDLASWHDELDSAARRAAAGIQASLAAALQAAQGYGQAAGAANVYAGSLQRLQALIPAVAAAQQMQNQLAAAQIDYDKGVKALEEQRAGGMARDTYLAQQKALTDAYKAATEQVSGLTDARTVLTAAERDAAIGSMPAQAAAAARITDRFEEMERQLIAAGASETELARLVAAKNQELENSAASFAKTGSAASGAAKTLKAAERDFNSFISTADKLAEALFPGEYARREAMELSALLEKYRKDLDAFQIAGLENEIGNLTKAAELNLRRLEEKTKDAARNMGEELKNTLGSILGDLFSKPIEDFDDFIDRVMSGLGQLGQANLSASMDMLFGGGDGLSKAVEKGAKAGTEAGSAGGIFDGLSSLFGGAGGGANGNALMGALGSAAGGLGIGYQAQDPVMGALGGALSGVAGGPLGIVAGALGGFIGGLFGANKALQEAQEKLAKLRGEIDSFLDVGEGRGVGEMTKAFREYWDKSHEYQELAMKAGDGALQKRLQSAVNTFFLQLDKDFRLGFEGTLEALSSGQGMAGAFVSAQQQIVGLREELKAFIADTEFMGNKLGELASLDNAAEVADNLARARRAAQDYALSVLSGALEMTEMEKAVAEAEGRASALQVTLEQLGMAAGEAAAAINDHLGLAIVKLRDEFTADLNASINDLSGFGFLNEIIEAQTKYQERLRDASALGLDSASAMQELNLSLVSIARSSGLTQSQIDMLAQTFPAMAGMLADLADNDAQRRLTDAQAALRAAYDAQVRVLETTINRLDRFITSVQKFRDNLRLDDNLSPLNPQERLIEAQRQFQTVMAEAMGGDEAALGRVEEVSRNYLEEARAYHGTSVQYFAIFEEVESLLDGVLASAKTQLSDAQRELALLQQQVGALIDINTSVLSVADAIANLAAAQAASDAALAGQLAQLGAANSSAISAIYQSALGREADAGGMAYWSNQISQGKSVGQVSDQISNSREAQIRQLYQSVLGRAADTSGLQYWMGSNKAVSQIEEELRYLRSIGSYASGGFTGYGGVNDPAGIVHRGEYVFDAASTSRIGLQNLDAMRAGRAGNDNGSVELVQELRGLRQEVAQLRAERKQGDAVVAAGAQAQVAAAGQTTQEVAKQSNAAWKAAHTRKTG